MRDLLPSLVLWLIATGVVFARRRRLAFERQWAEQTDAASLHWLYWQRGGSGDAAASKIITLVSAIFCLLIAASVFAQIRNAGAIEASTADLAGGLVLVLAVLHSYVYGPHLFAVSPEGIYWRTLHAWDEIESVQWRGLPDSNQLWIAIRSEGDTRRSTAQIICLTLSNLSEAQRAAVVDFAQGQLTAKHAAA